MRRGAGSLARSLKLLLCFLVGLLPGNHPAHCRGLRGKAFEGFQPLLLRQLLLIPRRALADQPGNPYRRKREEGQHDHDDYDNTSFLHGQSPPHGLIPRMRGTIAVGAKDSDHGVLIAPQRIPSESFAPTGPTADYNIAMKTRTEHDLLGELDVPADAYYGIHTRRAQPVRVAHSAQERGEPARGEMRKGDRGGRGAVRGAGRVELRDADGAESAYRVRGGIRPCAEGAGVGEDDPAGGAGDRPIHEGAARSDSLDSRDDEAGDCGNLVDCGQAGS